MKIVQCSIVAGVYKRREWFYKEDVEKDRLYLIDKDLWRIVDIHYDTLREE